MKRQAEQITEVPRVQSHIKTKQNKNIPMAGYIKMPFHMKEFHMKLL